MVNIGRKGFGANLVLAVEQIAPRLYFFDTALLPLAWGGGQPQHAVTDQGLIFFAPGVADAAVAIGALHHAVAAMAAHDQALLQAHTFCIASSWR